MRDAWLRPGLVAQAGVIGGFVLGRCHPLGVRRIGPFNKAVCAAMLYRRANTASASCASCGTCRRAAICFSTAPVKVCPATSQASASERRPLAGASERAARVADVEVFGPVPALASRSLFDRRRSQSAARRAHCAGIEWRLAKAVKAKRRNEEQARSAVHHFGFHSLAIRCLARSFSMSTCWLTHAGEEARPAADRRREGSRNQRRFASGQSRHHEGRGGAWRRSRDRSADQGGAGGLMAARLGAIRFYGPRRVLTRLDGRPSCRVLSHLPVDRAASSPRWAVSSRSTCNLPSLGGHRSTWVSQTSLTTAGSISALKFKRARRRRRPLAKARDEGRNFGVGHGRKMAPR